MIALWSAVAFASSVPACPARTAPALVEIVARSTGESRLRAAGCLLDRHPEQALTVVEAWMGDPEAADLARLVVERLDDLPQVLAVAAASTGVRGPHAAFVTPAVWGSDRAMVRAVLATDPIDDQS